MNLDATYTDLATVSDSDIDIIIEQDMTDEDSPRVNYLDLGADGVSTQIADQLEAPTHSGVVSFDMDNYKIADTVVVTLDDQDMNTDSSLIDIYTTNAQDLVGASAATNLATGLVLDITFDDLTWVSQTDTACANEVGTVTGDDGLEATGFTLVETDTESGIFVGSFQVPTTFCDTTVAALGVITTTTGTDIEVNYQDFRNASGESIEVGDGASINANTGSVTFDRTVYPVPYGNETAGEQICTYTLVHKTSVDLPPRTALAQGDVVVHVRVSDADYDMYQQLGEDTISDTMVTLHLNVERGSATRILSNIRSNTSASITQLEITVLPKYHQIQVYSKYDISHNI